MSDTGTNLSGPPPSGGAPGGGGAAPQPVDNWRAEVMQSYRNAEVREIAKVLAALDGPNTTSSSKLMLAMRFEDQIFKSANSLADYRKKLAKRLKKLQKTYTPPPSAASAGTSTGDQSSSTNHEEDQKQELLRTLRQKYRQPLRYIIVKAPAALRDIEGKLGPDDAERAKQHTDNCMKWGRELGVWTVEDDKKLLQQEQMVLTKREEEEEQQQQQQNERRIAGAGVVAGDKSSTSPTKNDGKDSSKRRSKKDDEDDDDDDDGKSDDDDDSKGPTSNKKKDDKNKVSATPSSSTTTMGTPATSASTATATATTTSSSTGTASSNTVLPAMLSLSQLQRMEQHLEKRVENIRIYVAKHADPDLFLLERLVKMDEDISNPKNTRANGIMTMNLSKRIEQLQQKGTSGTATTTTTNSNSNTSKSISGTATSTTKTTTSPLVVLQQALEKAQAAVPPPTRNDSKQTEAGLKYLDKMRAASTALMSYWTIKDDRITTAPRQTLQKLQAVISEGSDFVIKVMKVRRLEEEKARGGGGGGRNYPVLLQDAWAKTLEPPEQDTMESIHSTSSIITSVEGGSPPMKKLKTTTSYAPVYKARLVLHPNRKTPPALLDALKRKGARLVRKPNINNNKNKNNNTNLGSTTINTSYLELDFGSAFTMTIYLSPLVVIIRAMTPQQQKEASTIGLQQRTSSSSTTTTSRMTDVSMMSTPDVQDDCYKPIVWKPLSYGLTGSNHPSGNHPNSSSSLSTLTSGSSSPVPSTSSSPRTLSVWGVTGSYDGIGRVVEGRLQDASTQATRVLRRCFQSHVKDKTIDFEVEILEGSALLEFLQIARRTYMPGWQDYDP